MNSLTDYYLEKTAANNEAKEIGKKMGLTKWAPAAGLLGGVGLGMIPGIASGGFRKTILGGLAGAATGTALGAGLYSRKMSGILKAKGIGEKDIKNFNDQYNKIFATTSGSRGSRHKATMAQLSPRNREIGRNLIGD